MNRFQNACQTKKYLLDYDRKCPKGSDDIQRGHITISIYNLLGQKTITIVDEVKPAGQYSVIWDGKDRRGEQVASGIYFYNLRINDIAESKKMILLK